MWKSGWQPKSTTFSSQSLIYTTYSFAGHLGLSYALLFICIRVQDIDTAFYTQYIQLQIYPFELDYIGNTVGLRSSREAAREFGRDPDAYESC